MKRKSLLIFIVLAFYTACTTNERKVIDRAFYDSGELMSETYTTDKDSVFLGVEYYKNGNVKAQYQLDPYAQLNGRAKMYFPNGELKMNCTWSDGLCDAQSECRYPCVDSCYMMINGILKRGTRDLYHITPMDTLFLPCNRKIDFALYMNGFPYEIFKTYIQSSKDIEHYHEIPIINSEETSFPMYFNTLNSDDTLFVCVMFPNEDMQIIAGKTPQIRFTFIIVP